MQADGVAAKYWPRWRGPSGQGIVQTDAYPDRWSGREGVTWKVAVPGRGNSSPIVWDDRIFVTTAYDGGRRLSLLAFRRRDSVRLWETFKRTMSTSSSWRSAVMSARSSAMNCSIGVPDCSALMNSRSSRATWARRYSRMKFRQEL